VCLDRFFKKGKKTNPLFTSMATNTTPVVEVKEENEYLVAVKKRIRNYKKKLTNIANIEAKVANKEKINKEQEEALKSKDGVSKIVAELENVESQLIQIKKEEQQKQFSLEDVKTLLALFQTHAAVGHEKKHEGLTDQQAKLFNGSLSSLLKPKGSPDDTTKYALKVARDNEMKNILSKLNAPKQEAPTPSKEEKVETPAPTTTSAPVTTPEPQPTPVENKPPETAPVTTTPTTTTAPQSSPSTTAPTTATETPKENESDKEGKFQGQRRGPRQYNNGGNQNRGGPRKEYNQRRGGNPPAPKTQQ